MKAEESGLMSACLIYSATRRSICSDVAHAISLHDLLMKRDGDIATRCSNDELPFFFLIANGLLCDSHLLASVCVRERELQVEKSRSRRRSRAGKHMFLLLSS